ncbi:hypothetical protein K432DRAFT_356537 [Lepidopterella palustris CBS 459.81]|uniref:Uncharacterized protein n=1 Tax=Lepidopterella palustris CBS 459.81 TaxID=1314670 RepID=A0A8E2E7H4_9PEZI|nr:hypothetical protein K432DRAFT_356537 [Lepidopterella palustris CBS 459.81]
MKSQSTCGSAQWTDGLVVSAKNVDSMDTSGSNFLQSSQTTQTFEIVALKSPTWKHQFLTWIVTFESTISFIAHYLGLRSSKWWLAVCELVICLVAAFARSIAKDRQKRFQVVEGMKLDKRCTSTGIIRTQQASIVDTPLRRFDILDLRAYSGSLFEGHPLTAEHIAWHAAKICREKSPKTASNVLKLTGMLATAEHNNEQPETRAIFVSFLGGVLVTEGLAFPNIRVCIGFRARVTELGAPTPLLVRAIMRQPQWLVSHPQYGNITASLGNVYIFSINSIIDWWSLSEDRNDAHDLQKNLQWPFVLLNMAFYLALLESCVGDAQLLSGIEQAQQEASMESKGIAWAVVNFLEALRDEWMNE